MLRKTEQCSCFVLRWSQVHISTTWKGIKNNIRPKNFTLAKFPYLSSWVIWQTSTETCQSGDKTKPSKSMNFSPHANQFPRVQCLSETETVTAAVFNDTKKAFEATWHPSLLRKLSKIEFWAKITKLISHSFPRNISNFRCKTKYLR
jgi:hypothetical protein